MEKRVLIVGSTGMLGHQVLNRLEKNSLVDVFDFVFRTKRRRESIVCDVRDLNLLEEEIERIKPDVIVNCVGILINGSQKSIVNAVKVNSLLPHFLRDVCDNIGSKLIHISTDCVFSGNSGAYIESSQRDADDIYGRTKALGEINSLEHLTIRTSIVGPELKVNGEGLLHWFLTSEEKELNGFSQVFWGGVTTLELSKAIEFAIENDIIGLWNLTNGKEISKYEMLSMFNQLFYSKSKKIIKPLSTKVSNKSLKSERTDINYQVPSYKRMFTEMSQEVLLRKSDYTHYTELHFADLPSL